MAINSSVVYHYFCSRYYSYICNTESYSKSAPGSNIIKSQFTCILLLLNFGLIIVDRILLYNLTMIKVCAVKQSSKDQHNSGNQSLNLSITMVNYNTILFE